MIIFIALLIVLLVMTIKSHVLRTTYYVDDTEFKKRPSVLYQLVDVSIDGKTYKLQRYCETQGVSVVKLPDDEFKRLVPMKYTMSQFNSITRLARNKRVIPKPPGWVNLKEHEHKGTHETKSR